MDAWESQKQRSSYALPLAGAVVVAGLAIGVTGFAVVSSRWVRCPPNKLMTIYGTGTKPKFVHGGGSYVWPLYQQHKFIDLAPMQIPIDLVNTLSIKKVRINVPSVFTVAIGRTPEMMENASYRLLDMEQEDLKHHAAEIIFGQFRDVIASLDIQEMNADRSNFTHKVNESVGTELAKYGLELINVNFKDITDEAGVIKAMGEQAAAEAINSAKVDVATQNKIGDIGVARELLERDSEVARLTKETVVKVSGENNERDMLLAEQNRIKNVRINFEKTEQEKNIQTQESSKEVALQDLQSKQEIAVRTLQKEKTVEITKALMTEEASVQEQAANRDIQVSAAQLRQEAEIRALQAQKEIALAESENKEQTERALLQTKRSVAIAEAEKEENVNKVIIANSQRVAVSASNAEAVVKENETLATISTSIANLTKHQAMVNQEAKVIEKQSLAKVEEEEANARKLVALAQYERVRAELLASTIVEVEIEKSRRILLSEAEKAEGLAKIDVKAAEILEVQLAEAKAKKLRLEAEAEYVRQVVSACGGAEGAAKYFLVDKVEGLAKHSADAVKNIKFDKVILWDNGSRAPGSPNPAVQFVTDLVSSVAPAGELVKNVLGVDMKSYLGSTATQRPLPTQPVDKIEIDSSKE